MTQQLIVPPSLNTSYVFNNVFNIRILGTWDAPLFVASDICNVLGLKNSSETIKRIPDRDKSKLKIYNGRRMQSMNVLTESGLYRLIMRSVKPIAIKFQDWILYDIIPSIRKTGVFMMEESYIKKCDDLINTVGHTKQALIVANKTIKYLKDKEINIKRDQMEKHNPNSIPYKMTKYDRNIMDRYDALNKVEQQKKRDHTKAFLKKLEEKERLDNKTKE